MKIFSLSDKGASYIRFLFIINSDDSNAACVDTLLLSVSCSTFIGTGDNKIPKRWELTHKRCDMDLEFIDECAYKFDGCEHHNFRGDETYSKDKASEEEVDGYYLMDTMDLIEALAFASTCIKKTYPTFDTKDLYELIDDCIISEIELDTSKEWGKFIKRAIERG